jgi:anti-sigma B factor antagonist
MGMPNDTEPLLAEPLTVAISGDRTETVVTIDGEFDISGTGWFGACIGTALETHPGTMTIDAHGLTFMDSSGLQALLCARAAAAKAGVAFRISEPAAVLRHLAERTGLQGLLLGG